ncbi:hypothetical protein JCM11641_000422 [Rhodosporidiobolus odoratus]
MYGRGPPQDYRPNNGYGPPGGYQNPGGGGGGGYSGGQRSHAGLGAPGAPSSLPRPANLPQTPSFSTPPPSGFTPASGLGSPASETQDKFSLFVGSIVDGVENGWLEKILGVVGPVLSFRRPTPAFAFVEYADPESVLRCLEVVNGVNIKAQSGAEKPILVKADEKTRARLDEYEKGRVTDESTSDLTQQAKEDLTSILARIAAGDPITAAVVAEDESSRTLPGSGGPRLPRHLEDLAPEDLPDAQRTNTLSEISKFRERAVKRATEKHQLTQQIEERRRAMIESRVAQQRAQASGQQGSPTALQGASRSPSGPGQDPQSYNRPQAFVAGQNEQQQQQPQGDGELDDIKRERERAERELRHQEGIFRDRERRFEARERARIQAWEREAARERNVAEQEDRDRAFMAERLATWDDDREADRGRESFYIDRIRWRAQRKPLRAREAEADSRDRAVEAQHLASIEQRADSFLSQHADLFANSLPTGPGAPSASSAAPRPDGSAAPSPAPGNATPASAAGLPTSVKLSINAASKPATTDAPKPRPTALAMEDEEEEGRRKRALIPLSYSDDEEGPRPSSKAEVKRPSREETHRKQREIEDKVPNDRSGLWEWKVRWDVLGQDIVKQKILPFANQLIVKYLGGEEAELLNVVEEYLRDRKTPQDLLDELEPVLDEDATDFVVKIWRQLAVETELRHAGVDL